MDQVNNAVRKDMPQIPRRKRPHPTQDVPVRPAHDDEAQEALLLQMLHVEHLLPNSQQPRQSFDKEDLVQLAESIKRHGLIQPIVVRESSDSTSEGDKLYELVAGERRWRAAQLAGLTEIEARVVQADDSYSATLAIVENTHRADLSIVEVAKAYTSLIEKYGWTQQQLAEHVSSTRQQVGHVLAILKLSEEPLALLQSGELTLGHAKLLLQVKDSPELQSEIALECVREGLSVRALSESIDHRKKEIENREDGADSSNSSKSKRRSRSNPNWAPSVAIVEELLDTQARIRGSKGNYILEVRFSDADDLARIVEVMKQPIAPNG